MQETTVPITLARKIHGLAMVSGSELDMGMPMTWTTSDSGVVRVPYDPAGPATHDVLAVPVAPGQAVITATCAGLSGSCQITVLGDSLTMVFGPLVAIP